MISVTFMNILPMNCSRWRMPGQLDRIEKCIKSLDDMPERYSLYDREPWKSRGLHIVLVDNYCVLYIVDNNDRTVSVMRVMYGGRDIDVQLDKHTKYEE